MPCLLMPAFLQPSSMVLAEKYHGRKPWVSFRVGMTKVDVFFFFGNHPDPPDYGVNTYEMWTTCLLASFCPDWRLILVFASSIKGWKLP
jgi:hypothetical protein